MTPPAPVARMAGILCNDPRFQRFVAHRAALPAETCASSVAAEYLRRWCRIETRRELDHDTAALARFRILETEFDAWTGKIARPDDRETPQHRRTA